MDDRLSSEMTLAERVARAGAVLLDRYWPGWAALIDTDALDLTEGIYQPNDDGPDGHCGCVLAQLDYATRGEDFGLYPAGKDKLLAIAGLANPIGLDWVAEHGFLVVRPDIEPEDLDRAWINEIDDRVRLRKLGPSAPSPDSIEAVVERLENGEDLLSVLDGPAG